MQFGVFLDHRDDVPAHLLRQHGHLDVLVVLEAVADDGRFVVGHGHHGHQFGLGAGFQAELVRLAELQDLFHHLPLLVHLDGVDAAVAALVVVLGDGGLERVVDFAQPVLEDVGEADQDREVDAAQHQRVDQFLEIDGAGRILLRVDAHVPVVPDREIALAPAGDVVEIAGELRRPSLGGLHDQRGSFTAVSFQIPALTEVDFLKLKFPRKPGRGARRFRENRRGAVRLRPGAVPLLFSEFPVFPKEVGFPRPQM